MAGYMKLGDIEGESTDSFVFRSGGGDDANHKDWILIETISKDHTESGDPVPTEQLTMNYEKIEWTYNEGPNQYGNPDENDWTF